MAASLAPCDYHRPALVAADSPQVSHFPSLCLCFCIPRLSILSNCTAGLWGKWLFPLWRWLCDGSPVLVGNSKPCVVHAIQEMQPSERGTGPWEAFPMPSITMTEICFLHRQAPSMHVDKIQTGNNNCNNIMTLIKVRVPAGEKKIKGHLYCSSLPMGELRSSRATDTHYHTPAG